MCYSVCTICPISTHISFTFHVGVSEVNMITRTDCPSTEAEKYPGKRGRNNPAGILLTRKEYVAKQVEDWIAHFKDNEKYENEYLSVKVKYLVQHLKVLNISTKVARKLLVELESKHQEDGAYANLLEEREHEQNENDINMIDEELDVPV